MSSLEEAQVRSPGSGRVRREGAAQLAAIAILCVALLLASSGGAWAAAAHIIRGELPPPDGFAGGTAFQDAYRIAASDTLQIEVFNVDSLNRTVQVDASGRIDLPLIGGVQATDKTAAALADEIAKRLGEKYLQNPKVTVFVKSSAARRFTVEGAVKEPGVFDWQDKTTLMQVIAKAKGAEPSARIDSIMVFRKVQAQRVAGVFNLNDIRQGKLDDPEIYPEDLVVVSDSQTARWWRRILGASPLYMILGR